MESRAKLLENLTGIPPLVQARLLVLVLVREDHFFSVFASVAVARVRACVCACACVLLTVWLRYAIGYANLKRTCWRFQR